MQITKSTEHKAEKGLVPFKETVKEIPQKVGKFFSANQKRTLIVTASVLVVCAAVAINWMLFGPESNGLENPGGSTDVNAPGQTNDPSDTPVDNPGSDEVPNSFFAIAITDRQRARDEALEVLQTVVDSDQSSGEEKTQAAEAIARIASNIEAEANIETLIKSKGFEQCVAVVSDDNVSVIIGTDDTLMANELAQIKEIIYLQTGVDPTAMRITEKILENNTESAS
ncbi:MAG: SpoIIIAH-like family protein [Clostridia bacterium]|nr:SpoIIIAH-like family protein [Clostridia bacterium]